MRLAPRWDIDATHFSLLNLLFEVGMKPMQLQMLDIQLIRFASVLASKIVTHK